MREILIREIAVDAEGRLVVIPEVSESEDFPKFSAGMGIDWDPSRRGLRSPQVNGDGWSYARWFRQTLQAAKEEYDVLLVLHAGTRWQAPDDTRKIIERHFDDIARENATPPLHALGSTHRARGVVKWWRSHKGYGAITVEELAPWDVWFHYSVVVGTGRRNPLPGQAVEVEFMRIDRESFKYVARQLRLLL